jgi:hypothetical protein
VTDATCVALSGLQQFLADLFATKNGGDPDRLPDGLADARSRRLLRQQHIAATTAAFPLIGASLWRRCGYCGGSVKLQRVMGDGTSLISVSSGTDFTANGYGTVNLPSGNYKLVVATSTAVYVQIRRIPGE